MLDMIGKEVNVGDLVIFPGGNARYGGLKFVVGLVTKLTQKRMTLLTSYLLDDGKDPKIVNKSGHKVLKCPENFAQNWDSVKKIKAWADANNVI